MIILNKYKEEFYKELSSFKDYISEPDYSVVPHYIDVVRSMDKIENKPMYLLDLYKQEFLFVSERYKYLLGQSENDSEIDFDFFVEILHPDDFKSNTEAPVEFQKFVAEQPEGDRLDYKLLTDFRLKMPSGEYVRVFEQLINLKFDKNYNPWLVLSITDLSSNQNPELDSGAKIVNSKTGQTVKTFAQSGYLNLGKILTEREKEVLILISKGYLSKQIAGKLDISINTVNNHRRNILTKTNCSNTFEAIKLIADFGI